MALPLLLACGGPPRDDAGRRSAIDSAYRWYSLAFPFVDSITVGELRAAQRAGRDPLLVDVRPPEERQVSMLPGAISLEALQAAPERYRDRQVVLYCTVGARSGLAARSLAREGFEVRNLRGSILAWTHAGGDLVTPEGEPTRRVHVYSPDWDLVASGYEPVVTDASGQVQPVTR